MCDISERSESAVSGLQSDIAGTYKDTYLALALAIRFKRIACGQIVTEYRDL